MRVSLKQLLIIVAICAAVFAVTMWLTDEWRRKRAIRLRLEESGASWVGFSDNTEGFQTRVLFSAPPKRMLARHGNIRSVEFKLFDIDPGCFDQLKKLPALDSLAIVSCRLDDGELDALRNLPPVSMLMIWNANISDKSIDAIAGLQGLKRVVLKNTSVTAAGQARLEQLLPQAKVFVVP